MRRNLLNCTEVHFASFLSGGFITAIVVNPPERKLAKRTSVQWPDSFENLQNCQNEIHKTRPLKVKGHNAPMHYQDSISFYEFPKKDCAG
jgi:hypothetical protein